MTTLRDRARSTLAALLEWVGLPGGEYLDGSYLLWRSATVFPGGNLAMLEVDEDVQMHGAFFNLQDSVRIESGVVLGHQVMFLTGMHGVGPDGVDVVGKAAGPIVVETGAWLASRSTILGGVTIGKGSVVGAGAVVTRSVPSGEFWAGVPARMVGRASENGKERSVESEPNEGQLG